MASTALFSSGRAFSLKPAMPLVNFGNSAARAADVIESRLRDFEPYAEPLQAGGRGPAQVVQAPNP